MPSETMMRPLAGGAGVLLAMLAQGVAAQTTAETMTSMADRIAISKVQQQQMDLDVRAASRQLELLKLKNEIEAIQGGDTRLPWLKGVEGIGGKLVATLVMPDGQVIDAVPGTELPNKMRVSAIRPTGVSLTSGKRARTDLIVRAAGPAAGTSYSQLPGGSAFMPAMSSMPSLPMGLPTPSPAQERAPGAPGVTGGVPAARR